MLTENAPNWLKSLFSEIQSAGFPLVSAVDFKYVLEPQEDGSPALFSTHINRYENWIEDKKHGEMGYLERGLERRRDPRTLMPKAQSMITLAIPYRRTPPKTESGIRYARYLQGADYHKEIPQRLEPILKSFQHAELKIPLEWKICVDTSAILERSWAAITGLGWIGKNTLLINPQYGSYLFLAEILLNLETGEKPKLLKDYCGNCTRCLTACPTEALNSHDLDSNKCISYLTLEKRGPVVVDNKTWVAGCDICQEVCPFNSKPTKLPETWSEAENPALVTEALRLQNETEAEYKMRIRDSSLSRIKYIDFKRNLENAQIGKN